MRLNLYVFTKYILLLFFLSACPVKNQSMLLTDQTPCTAETCPQTQTSITGTLGLFPSQTSMYVNVDQSDLAEVSGSCTDLGDRTNKIVVEAYEGEDTSVGPYMNNDASYKCIGSATPVLNNKRCLFLPEGKGLSKIDEATSALITEYPQCFNGRFSFSVRLGKILRTDPSGSDNLSSNPLRNYLVRMKIVRGDGGNPIESGWNQVVISRSISKPSFSTSTDGNTGICSIKTNAFRNVKGLVNGIGFSDVRYKGVLSAVSYSNGSISNAVLPGTNSILPLHTRLVTPVYPLLPCSISKNASLFDCVPLDYPHDLNIGDTLENFKVYNLYPGLKYNIKLIAEDRNPDYVYTLNQNQTITNRQYENSGYSAEGQCYSYPSSDRLAYYAVCGAGSLATACQAQVKNAPNVHFSAEASNIEWVFIKNGPQTLPSNYDTSSIPNCNFTNLGYTTGYQIPLSQVRCKYEALATMNSIGYLPLAINSNACDVTPVSIYFRYILKDLIVPTNTKYGDWSLLQTTCSYRLN